MAAISEHAPPCLLGFLELAVEPGAVVGYATALLVATFHVTPELHATRAIGVADVTEQEGAKSHKQ